MKNAHVDHYVLHIRRKSLGRRTRAGWYLHETTASRAHAYRMAQFLAKLDEVEAVTITALMRDNSSGVFVEAKRIATMRGWTAKLISRIRSAMHRKHRHYNENLI